MLSLMSLIFLVSTATCWEYIFRPGPVVPATQGQVWPQPQCVDTLDDKFFTIIPLSFRFKNVGNSCGTLKEALNRYEGIIATSNPPVEGTPYKPLTCGSSSANFSGILYDLEVKLTGSCNDHEYPTLDAKEEYVLNVTSTVKRLTSQTIWGILRGLETFSQLIYLTNDYSCHRVDTNSIHDYPRFPHRGLLLDTSRHYYKKDTILRFLDALSYNKFNVFHWHIVDDNSFPYVSKKFQALSAKGAFYKTFIYDQKFVAEVQEYARKRGIRVVVEFDTPGHTLSWGLGNPDLLTKCYNVPSLEWGPIDPTKNSTYTFIFQLFDEIKQVFKDKFVHLGGDEVSIYCWATNPAVNQFMIQNGIAGNFIALQALYFQKLLTHVTSLNLQTIVWQDVFDSGIPLPASTVVEVWQDTDPAGSLFNVTAAGHRAIIASYWYLDIVATGGDWLKFYNVEPLDFAGTDEQKSLVIGGEAAKWSEVSDDHNLESITWPRGSVPAEKLWSARSDPLVTLEQQFLVAARLQEQTCRLNKRGIGARPPTGPSFCL